MASLFQGSPQTATSYSSSTSETPKWMQDAIYNQIQWATNVANTPYQGYDMPTVAGMTPEQQQAYKNVVANQGAWQGSADLANKTLIGATTAGTSGALGAAQNQYLNPTMSFPGAGGTGLPPGGGGEAFTPPGWRGQGVNPDYATGAGAPPPSGADLAGRNLSESQRNWSQAGNLNIPGAAAGALGAASQMSGAAAASPYAAQANQATGNITASANPYLQTAAGSANNITSASQPYLQGAGQTAAGIAGAAAPYTGAAGASAANILANTSPYMQAASQTSAANVGQYMSPYQQNAMDTLAKQGARNLSENLLPSVSDAFIRAGQFGGTRMGEFGSRAFRDTQEAVLDKQAQMINQAYGQALGASGADLARQAQLAGTAGQLTAQQAGTLNQIAQTTGGLTAQQAAALSNVGQVGGQLAGQQANIYGTLGQTAGQLAGQQANAYNAQGQLMGQLTNQGQQNLTNIGQVQGQLTAQQMQNLSTLANQQATAGQAQQQLGLTAAQQAQAAQAADLQRQMQAGMNLNTLAQQQNAFRAADVASLEAAGQAQQAQEQRLLDAARMQEMERQSYPKQQLDWLNTQVRGMAPITDKTTINQGTTTGATYSASPLSQLASGAALYKGLSNLG